MERIIEEDQSMVRVRKNLTSITIALLASTQTILPAMAISVNYSSAAGSTPSRRALASRVATATSSTANGAGSDLVSQGIAAYKAGLYKQAIGCMEWAISNEQNTAIAHYYYGMASRQLGLEDDAAREFRIAHSLDPVGPIGAYSQIALYGTSNTAEVKEALRLCKLHAYAKALPLLKAAVTKVPRDGTAHYYLGVLYGIAGLYDEADSQMSLAYSVDPTVDMGLLPGVKRMGDNDDFRMADSVFSQQGNAAFPPGTANGPNNSTNSGNGAGTVKTEAGELQAGALAYRQKQFPEAIDHLKNAIADNNNDLVAHYYLALTYDKIGAKDEAKDEFSFVHTMGPTNLAGKYSELAMFGNTNVKALSDGISSYQKHDFKGAAKQFSEAAHEIPRDPLAHYYLGLSADYMNQRMRAVKQYESAYRLNPTGLVSRYCKLAVSGSEPFRVVAQTSTQVVRDNPDQDNSDSDDDSVVKKPKNHEVFGSVMNYLSTGNYDDDEFPEKELVATPFKLTMDKKKWTVLPKPFSAKEKQLILDHDALHSMLHVQGKLLPGK